MGWLVISGSQCSLQMWLPDSTSDGTELSRLLAAVVASQASERSRVHGQTEKRMQHRPFVCFPSNFIEDPVVSIP